MSYLQKQMEEEDFLIKEADKGDFGLKFLFLGLAQTGKSSIIKVVFENTEPDKTSDLTATVGTKRQIIDFSGYNLNVYDVGGQITYLEEAFVVLRESIFSQLKALFFVIDSTKMDEIETANLFFRRARRNAEEYSPYARIFVLAHKIDLIEEEKRENLQEEIKEKLQLDKYEKVVLLQTSIFEESIFKAMEKALD